ncbi:methionine adenosyltransferase [archaeon]|nr:methionine adenosyltransferase [archaeon]|tara:strand:- start:580 stop:1749 length:1170 start_codon:yes stop_codon:yes gene_type:complete
MRKGNFLFTSESVTAAHPDKTADNVSDAIYDEMLKQDPESHAGIECFCTTGLLIVGGEAKTKANVNIEKVAREALKKIGYNSPDTGYNADDVAVMVTLHEQSPDIAQGVDEGTGEFTEQGAGDQGLMFGFATNETKTFMPLPIHLAHRLTEKLTEVRENGELPYLRPDGKSQVTIQYEDGKPKKVETVVIAAHHADGVSMDKLREDIKEKVIKPVCGEWMGDDTKFFINATGKFVLGGPPADAGLTGRKIIVDTYGGYAPHGGGAFSGKCITKVDRSGAYYARYVAKNVVAAGLADQCEVQVAYAIGVADPVSVSINTFETGKIPDEKIAALVTETFDFKPKSIIEQLDLKRPIYQKTAAYGHFGRDDPDFTWEHTDKADALKQAAGLA